MKKVKPGLKDDSSLKWTPFRDDYPKNHAPESTKKSNLHLPEQTLNSVFQVINQIDIDGQTDEWTGR